MSHTALDEKRLARLRTHVEAGNQVRSLVVQHCGAAMLRAVDRLARSFRQSRKVLLCGNGGSAADCQHIAAELMSRLTRDVERPGLPAIALTTDTSFLTAFSNDCGFEGVFARQVQALGQADDVLIAISTSGESPNVLRAVNAAKDLGLHTIGLVGDAGRLASMVDIAIEIPSRNTQYIQEAMLAVEHILCDLTERALFDPEFEGTRPDSDVRVTTAKEG
jgi:D-sedoheptulose 7-phosphate isomerase